MKSYKELIVWQKAYRLVIEVYKVTDKFPKQEQFGLTLQMRRCAVSIVSNIAEGYQRQYTGEYIQFLSVAFGYCAELETQLLISKDLTYLASNEFNQLIDMLNEVSKMLYSLTKKLKTKHQTLNPIP